MRLSCWSWRQERRRRSSGGNEAWNWLGKACELGRDGCYGGCCREFFGYDRAAYDGAGRGSARGLRGNALVGLGVFSHAANGGADGVASLVFGDRLGQNQFCAQAKSSWQPGAAIDDGDRDRVVAVFSATANGKDQLGGGQIFKIDQHQVEALRIKFLGSGYSVQRTLASH